MMLGQAVSVVLISAAMVASCVAGDETTVTVKFRTKSVRIKPSYNSGGADVTFAFLFSSSGSVTEKLLTSGLKPEKHQRERPINSSNNDVKINMIGDDAFERIYDAESHIQRIAVKIKGRTCTADVRLNLKPGKTEYRSYSTQLGVMAMYKSIKVVQSSCVIS